VWPPYGVSIPSFLLADGFLEAVLSRDATSRLLRIGGRSESAQLDAFNLGSLRQYMRGRQANVHRVVEVVQYLSYALRTRFETWPCAVSSFFRYSREWPLKKELYEHLL
jgi:hypothetical protein